ncbi:MAG: HisA/HisF-related TIM barrel protein, partial [Candidatus Hydrothermarchaeales archaeon]
TVEDPAVLAKALERFGERVIVSIDIKGGSVLSDFLPPSPSDAYRALGDMSAKKVIFLDISAVGTLKADFSFIKDLNKTGEILVGGGIMGKDLTEMERIKVDGVLVGTALHKGLLEVESWKS